MPSNTTKHATPGCTHEQVLSLRRSHSARQTAELTGLPLGTIKAICSRSGAFRDNPKHRALFSLPEPRPSDCTGLVVPELPPQEPVTGHKELDALLWLRQVISTGDPALIDKAMEAAGRIKTPLKALEKAYTTFLTHKHPNNPFATFAAVGLDDLKGLADRATKAASNRAEAMARFGDERSLFDETPAERFCVEVLEGTGFDAYGALIDATVTERMKARPEYLPHTLADCLRELHYWRRLYSLRHAVDRDAAESSPECYGRERFAFAQMAHIRPRSRDEAAEVLRYLAGDADRLQDEAAADILRNLIA